MASIESEVRRALTPRGTDRRQAWATFFLWLCRCTAVFCVLILGVLLWTILSRGTGSLSWRFLTGSPHPDPSQAGILPALMGTFWTCAACACLTFPIGLGTAIFLEELRPRNRFLRWLHGLVQINIANLAGVPSVVYGIVGMTAFVSMFGLFQPGGHQHAPFEIGIRYFDQFLTIDDSVLRVPVTALNSPETKPTSGLSCYDAQGKQVTMSVLERGANSSSIASSPSLTVRWSETPGRASHQSWYHFRLPFGRSVLAGSLTLMLVILPVIILASQEAFRSVPPSLREAALGMGATPCQAVWRITLPAATPGIMTGTILAMSRAIGEAAPIMMISGIVFITRAPSNLMSVFTVLSLQIYDWAGRHEAAFHRISAAAILVLLTLLLLFNAVAIYVRQRFTKPLS
jgi:phosphate transport system permease protein